MGVPKDVPDVLPIDTDGKDVDATQFTGGGCETDGKLRPERGGSKPAFVGLGSGG